MGIALSPATAFGHNIFIPGPNQITENLLMTIRAQSKDHSAGRDLDDHILSGPAVPVPSASRLTVLSCIKPFETKVIERELGG
jgi:hypothetical protein